MSRIGSPQSAANTEGMKFSVLHFFELMTTIPFSTGKSLGFYSQSLQDKLYPVLGNGEKLILNEIFQLLAMAGEAPMQCYLSGTTECQIWALLPEDSSFVNFDEESDAFLYCDLAIEEWLAFARWLAELAEIRSLDYKRALRESTQN